MSRVPFFPEALKAGLSAIADKPVFCTWKLVPNEAKPDKPKKVPCIRGGSWLTGGFSNPELKSNLMPLVEVISAVYKYGHDGVGLVFSPGCGVVGIDLDDCIDDAFVGTSIQQQAFSAFESHAFIERSQSGTGLHSIALGNATTHKMDGVLELFGDKNFLALTGLHGYGVAAPIPTEKIDEVDALIHQLKGTSRRSTPINSDINSDLTEHLKSAESTVSIEVLRAALRYLDPGMSRDQWLTVVWAIRHGLGDTPEALKLADQWSKGELNA
jgi:primase-polymerase (primpol)-like protein